MKTNCIQFYGEKILNALYDNICFCHKNVVLFRQFLICYSIADLSSVQIPEIFHFHECLTGVVTLPIWSFPLNQALYTLMLYSWSEAKKLFSQRDWDLSKDEIFIFPIKAQLPLRTQGMNIHTCLPWTNPKKFSCSILFL